MNPPPIGLTHSNSVLVDERLTVPKLPAAFTTMADMPPVFATAYMVAFVEATCIDALAPYLSGEEATVGTHIDMSHVAATPIGLTVVAHVDLVAVEGRKLGFRVSCRDDNGLIGEGRHERFVIDRARFVAKLGIRQGA